MSTYYMKPGQGWAYLVPGDMHYPFNHAKATAAMIEWWEAEKLHHGKTGVILQGDTVDPFGLSRFPKPSGKYWNAGKVMTAVDKARPFVEYAARHPLPAIFLKGNHEDWIQQCFDALPALDGCPGLDFGALTGLGSIDNLEILEYKTRILLGDKLVVVHGKELPNGIDATLRKHPDQFTVRGHDHRVYNVYNTVWDAAGEPGIRGLCSVGMLAAREAYQDYADYPNFQLGFGVLKFFGRRRCGSPFFRVEEHVIVEDGGKCVVI